MKVEERRALLAEARESGALAELSEPQRQAIELWAAGCGYKRMAVTLQISRDSARGRVDRAVMALRLAAVERADGNVLMLRRRGRR